MIALVRFAVGMFLVVLAYAPVQAVADDDNQLLVTQQYAKIKNKFSDITDAVATDLDQLGPANELVFVDVRKSKEQAVSMIPGALTEDEFEARWQDYRNKTVVAYCTIGYRSGRFAQRWSKRGIKVVNLAGGILAWAHAGKPLQTPSGIETKRIHTYGRDWNLVPQGYTPIW